MFYPDQFISCPNCPNSVAPYFVEKGGYLLDNSTSSCNFCGTANSNSFLADMNLNFEIRWRNFGVGVLCLPRGSLRSGRRLDELSSSLAGIYNEIKSE